MRWLCASLLLVLSCSPTLPRPAPTPDPGASTCDSACTKLRELGCDEAKPTAKGASCEQVCLNVMTSGVIAWNLGCRSAVTTCAAADACEGKP
jgi:hypothetical protein